MSRQQGFARGDFDTSFPLDDKFLELRGSIDPLHYYAAVGVYWHVAAAAWREADRKPGARTCSDAADLLAELTRVGLLDSEGRLKVASFRRWVGKALASRKADSDRKARNRTGVSRGTPPESHGVPQVSATTRASGRDGSGNEGTDVEGGPGGDDPILDVYSRYYVRPTADALRALDKMGDEYTPPLVAKVMAEVGARQGRDNLISNTRTALVLAVRSDERAEREAEKARNAEKRRPSALRHAPEPDISDEEAERQAREFRASVGASA